MGTTPLKVAAVVAFVLLGGVVTRMTYEQTVNPSTPAQAQADLYDCCDFTYQEEAQAVFDQDPTDPYGLDEDDPRACYELWAGSFLPPVAEGR